MTFETTYKNNISLNIMKINSFELDKNKYMF